MRVSALAVLLLAARPGAAHPVTTGTGQRIRRDVEPSLRLVFVRQAERGELRLFSVSGDLRIGQHYDLVDSAGPAGQVEVTTVESTDENCPGFVYQRATGRSVAPGDGRTVDWNRVLAVGPVSRSVPHARFVPAPEQLGPVPADGDGSLYGAIDLDGDGEPDLARAIFQCEGVAGRPAANAGHVCVADYARRHGAWREVSRVRLPCR